MQRFTTLLVVAVVLASVSLPLSTVAQADRCFPETGQCISGRFRQYWEQNGGLAVFGYPITPAQDEVNADTGQTYLTQWFERNRFELHTDTAAPYDVQLGRLGDARLKQQGRDWFTFPKGQQTAGCLWFPETGHSVCEPFRSYWETHGLLDPALNPYARSLALFGLPLSERTMETNASGDAIETQWFERARFECHANNPPEFRVLLGLLGNEVRQNPAIPGAKPAVTCTVTTPAPPPPTGNCDPSYPSVCIPPAPPDLDCADVPHRNFPVRPPDSHRLDGDGDGIACEGGDAPPPPQTPTATALPASPAPPAPVPTTNPLNTGGRDLYNCGDFATYSEALAVYRANLPGDPNRLDGDSDGIPCESLPGAP